MKANDRTEYAHLTNVEQKEFAIRLRTALEEAGYPTCGPSELARNFNQIYPGQPVTPHCARKWLLGIAIPRQDKVRVLADWLGVPVDWLRFGKATPAPSTETHAEMTAEERAVLLALRKMTGEQRESVMAFIQNVSEAAA